ncbi:DinB family protein [Cohnella caldifontis]|uniref:DinB family protein n=1 Tax=Cohnella caldifontis TaxID=3027471 RepID=UPI0023EAED82|nr:DinB family protein [Cohnella sp. YIM B05605]
MSGAVNLTEYLGTYDRLQDAIEGLTEEQLKRKPAPGHWSITEVIAHLADHNIVVSFRIREILSGSGVRLPAFNQDPWIDGQKANQGNASDFLQAFRALLVHNAQLFVRLDPEDWSKPGVNYKGETVTLAGVVQGFIDHVGRHLGQIERIKKA